MSPEVDAQVLAALQALELAVRNAEALLAWRTRRAWPGPGLDAYPPLGRLLVDRWFERQRDLARTWMARSLFFRRQA